MIWTFSTTQEAERRQRQVETLASQYVRSETQFMSADKNDNDRNELLNNGRPSYWQGGNLNDDDDDDDDEPIADFRPKPSSFEPTVDDLRKHQNRILDNQNEGLEALSKVISRQKNLALRIGDEFDEQNGLFLFYCVFFLFGSSKFDVRHIFNLYFQLSLITSLTQWIQQIQELVAQLEMSVMLYKPNQQNAIGSLLLYCLF